MKKLFTFLALMWLAASQAFAQGSITLANVRVYMPDCTTLVPPGRFAAELIFAPDGTPLNSFDNAAVRVGATSIIGPLPGQIAGGGRTVTTITPAGGFGLFQVRVWETAAGFDYNSAVATGNPAFLAGKSAVWRIDTADPTTTPPQSSTPFPQDTICLSPIPEPSVMSLISVGLGGLLLWRKRRASA